ncbi:hypothetical protein CRM22_000446 [Opisthorchis felineus]|uniref:G-protein coupled receptors family 3 profile domain-containing protein n=1 Tax=Opisthorchis felineus TaxID=147828 RepID=A0A4S2MF23_OPIFE|nr:hypothetical protein CRM22_000446 [Opisthorchis felineus]
MMDIVNRIRLHNGFITMYILCTFVPIGIYNAVPFNTASREDTLRKFINYVQSEKTFCFPDAWSPGSSQDSDGSLTKRPLLAFHQLFTDVITPYSLMNSFHEDVKESIRIMRVINRLFHLPQGIPTNLMSELLNSYIQAAKPVTFRQTNDLTTGNVTPASQNVTSVLAIGLCKDSGLISYATSGTEMISPAIPRKACAELKNAAHRYDLSFTEETIYERFQMNWVANQCEQIAGRPAVIRAAVRPVEGTGKLHLFFELNMENFTLDQCKLNIHRCGATTRCVYKRYAPYAFAMDNYVCQCTEGFFWNNAENGFPAPFIHHQLQMVSGETIPSFQCRACPSGCSRCGGSEGRTCEATLDFNVLRAIPLAVQSFCITVCLLLGLTLLRLRRTRVIKAANWILMEILLLGAILLYLIVIVMYFPASDITCILVPWLRELGFSIMYGVLIVKIYRVLSAFQSRKAHRVHVRDKDILKFLGIFIVTTFTYMVAWTAVNLDYISSAPWNPRPDVQSSVVSMIRIGQYQVSRSTNEHKDTFNNTGLSLDDRNLTSSLAASLPPVESVTFEVCRALSWDIVVELSEFIILAVSIHYCRLVRTAPSEYNETLYISIALIIELTVSGIFNIVRHLIWYSVHPDHVFLLYFARSHITVTANLLLIFGPKVWFIYRPSSTVTGQGRSRASTTTPYTADATLASAGKLPLTLNGDLDIADVNLSDMDPEVIRRELKRLYTQIELYKTKAMRKDNPHISKRRGGRKQRRFSLQPFHKRHHGQTGSGNVPIMVAGEVGEYGWTSGRGSKGVCPKHGRHYMGFGQGATGPSGSAARQGSYHVHSSIVHDEEVSRLSEESTNSADDLNLSISMGPQGAGVMSQQEAPGQRGSKGKRTSSEQPRPR